MDLGFRHEPAKWPSLPRLKQGPGGFLSLLVDGGLEPCSAVLCLVTQSCLTLCKLMDSSPPGSSLPWDSPGKNTGVGCHALLQGNLPNSGIKPSSPILQADSLPTEPPGKPRAMQGTG